MKRTNSTQSVAKMIKATTQATTTAKATDAVSISAGNIKLGTIPSVSLPPIVTCAHCERCAGQCYAVRMANRHANTANAWGRNLGIYRKNADAYFAQIAGYCMTQAFFRWHVAGDIISAEYLAGMVRVAKQCKNCKFLVFTKSAEIVNEYFAKHKKPRNLQIILSKWHGVGPANPHDLPTSDVISEGDEIPQNGFLCGGSCTECIQSGRSCWSLKKSECVYFLEH